jgi:hypothetical protein
MGSNHSAEEEYWRDIGEIINGPDPDNLPGPRNTRWAPEGGLRKVVNERSQGERWERRARRIDLTGVAQAAFIAQERPIDIPAITTKTKIGDETIIKIKEGRTIVRQSPARLEENAEHKALRLAAKGFRDLLIAARDYQLEAAARALGQDDNMIALIVGNFGPAIFAAEKFARPDAMTAVLFVAGKVIAAIKTANRADMPETEIGDDLVVMRAGSVEQIPEHFGVAGLVIEMTLAALWGTPALRDLEADAKAMRAAKKKASRQKKRPIKLRATLTEDERKENLREVLRKQLSARLPRR